MFNLAFWKSSSTFLQHISMSRNGLICEVFLPKLSIFFTFFSLHLAAALRFLSLFSRAFSSSFWLEDLEEKPRKSVGKIAQKLEIKNITLEVTKYLLKYCLASVSYLGVMSSRLGSDRFWLLLCWLGAGEWIGLNGGGDRWIGCWMKICKRETLLGNPWL